MAAMHRTELNQIILSYNKLQCIQRANNSDVFLRMTFDINEQCQ